MNALHEADARMATCRASLQAAEEAVLEATRENFDHLFFFTDEVADAEIDDIHITSISKVDSNILALGDGEFTAELLLDVEYSSHVSFDDPDFVYRDPDSKDLVYCHRISGGVTNVTEIAATVKIRTRGPEPELINFDLRPTQIEVTSLPTEGDWDD